VQLELKTRAIMQKKPYTIIATAVLLSVIDITSQTIIMKQAISKDIGTSDGRRWPKGSNNKMKSYVMYKTCSYNFKVKKKKSPTNMN